MSPPMQPRATVVGVGKRFMGVQRATFIIDGDGRVAHAIPKASPKTHDDVVLEALAGG